MEEESIKVESAKLISQRCYPSKNTLANMPLFVKSIEQEDLRHVVTTILCCGFRIGEVMNSFIFKDHGRIIIQSPIEKKFNFTKHKMPSRGFLGETYLNSRLTDYNFWKSVDLKAPWGKEMEVGWINDYLSDDAFTPTYLFPKADYWELYHELKKYSKMELLYFRGKYMNPITLSYNPGFHYLRKAFIAQSINKELFKTTSELVSYIKWEHMDQILFYHKYYYEGDTKGATEVMFGSKNFNKHR